MKLVLRNGVAIVEPLKFALLFLENDGSYQSYDLFPVAQDATVALSDIRAVNRIRGRMSERQVQGVYERRRPLEAALSRIEPAASLSAATEDIPWGALEDLYRAGDGVAGVGLAKLTKFLHKKRPRLIPILDSVIASYLRAVDVIPPPRAGFGAIGTALTRSYKVDIDRNLEPLLLVQTQLRAQGFDLSECRVLDMFIWMYAAGSPPSWAKKPLEPAAGSDVDEAAELASDLGLALDGDGSTRAILTAALAEVGFVRARREIRRWLRR